jgi:hypothetical protein
MRLHLSPRVLSEHMKFGQWDFAYRDVYCRNIWSSDNEISLIATCIVGTSEVRTMRFHLLPRLLLEHLKFGQWDFINRLVYCWNIWSSDSEISLISTCIIRTYEVRTLDKWTQRSPSEKIRFVFICLFVYPSFLSFFLPFCLSFLCSPELCEPPAVVLAALQNHDMQNFPLFPTPYIP